MNPDDADGIIENDEEIFQETDSPNFLLTSFNSIFGFVETNGWLILIAAIVLYFIFNEIKKRSSQVQSEAGSDLADARNIQHAKSIEEARLRQQAAFEAAKLKYLEEKRLKVELAAKEKAEEWERHKQGLGYHNKTKKPEENHEEELAKLGLSSHASKEKKPRLRTIGPSSGSGGACFRRPGGGANRGG